MRNLDIGLIHHRILHGRVDFCVSKKLLHLLDGHALIYGFGGERTAEFVGMHLGDIETPAQIAHPYLYTADLQAIMRALERDEQRGIIIRPAQEIILQVYFCSGVEIDRAFLASLAQHNAFASFEVDVGTIEAHQFAHTHSCRGQHIYDRQVAQVSAFVTHQFQHLVAVCLLDGLGGFHLVYAANRTFEDVVFIFQPCEKAGEYSPDVVDRHFSGTAVLLVFR